MANTPVVMATTAQLTASAATYYTVPANKLTLIRRITLTNTSAGAESVTLHLVASGGAAANNNMILKGKTLAPGQSYVVAEAEGHVMSAGMTLQALASAATAITIRASGLEMTI